jgi:hypothetical protein
MEHIKFAIFMLVTKTGYRPHYVVVAGIFLSNSQLYILVFVAWYLAELTNSLWECRLSAFVYASIPTMTTVFFSESSYKSIKLQSVRGKKTAHASSLQ